MTSYESSERLDVELDDNVLIVRLNRPDAMNAFDDALHAEFPALMRRIESDGDLRAVVLTGNGKAFSAGGNIHEFETHRVDFAARRRSMRQARRLVDEMLNVHVPAVAAVNGPAVGLGATLMTLCDIVLYRRSRVRHRPARRRRAGGGGRRGRDAACVHEPPEGEAVRAHR